ncbi:MAG: hypothetical protein HGA29_01505, partial [Syntrophaceae bacterium]|nr:hypothetical protein [Syntrophaceae bacterium]
MTDNIKEYDPPVSVKAGQIQFIEACHPPLVAGRYKVRMTQVVQESKESNTPWNSKPYETDLQFDVDAPRFMLDPADIHCVYPPVDQTGRFDNALPHVVFTRRTLPWERTLDTKPPILGNAFPPWMALLLIQEDELWILDAKGEKTNRKYEIRSLPVVQNDKDKDSLLYPESSDVLIPQLGQDTNPADWKNRYEKDYCMAIDIPAELFQAIAPRYDDLPYLAHVRQVDTGDKEVLAINDKGWFSLIIGNRLPQSNKEHCVFLVSLEGHLERLNESWKPGTDQLIRLVVLGTWKFKCGESNDFKAQMSSLKPDSLRLPCVSCPDQSPETEDIDIVNGAYSRGYTAFNHTLRHGEKTVSWYRGPLVPLNYDKQQQIQEPVSCADELLHYDPDTGLFDVTYAAAWQIGRLLALQNHSFALALNRARKMIRQEAERQMRQK